jgi:hypothetical protein
MPRILLVPLVVLLAACATVTVSPKASTVQVLSQNSTLLLSCRQIGPVRSTSGAQLDPYVADMDAAVKLREAAADLGADTVVVVGTDGGRPNVSMQGLAFKCR